MSVADDPLEPGEPPPKDARALLEAKFAEEARVLKEEAEQLANEKGWKIRGTTPAGRFFELQAVEAGRPVYYITENANAAISTGANLIRQTAPYDLSGNSHTVGVWDGGAVRDTHQEFGGRVNVMDGASADNHATHVGGTIGASGVQATAKGMAPEVTIDSYDWTSDESEMASRGAAVSGEAGRINISNHSYGTITGWENGDWSGNSGPHWWGSNHGTDREDEGFGQYNSGAVDWDEICYAAPYYLPFKSAGNDRNDGAPGTGATYYYWSGGWQSATYDAATSPFSDGYDNGGFDTISSTGVAKNIMTVGAVNDAVSGGARNPGSGTMSSFSGWGPADDGRIKPDVVANGVGLYSSLAGSNASYGTYSGTSMSSPNAAGSAVLLQEYYDDLSGGERMRASSLKALIIHTADDVGRPGPDYSYGWGLMNVKAAADQIQAHFENPGGTSMVEGVLNASNPEDTYTFSWDGVSPIRATLCWTDPAGTAKTALDDRTAVLVNDLDLSLAQPGGGTVDAFALDPLNPSANAVASGNSVDPVEQVLLSSPAAGLYTLTVNHKGGLTDGEQRYSLILSGQAYDDMAVTPAGEFVSSGSEGGPFSPTQNTYTIQNLNSSGPLSWTASDDADWLELSAVSGTIAAGGSFDVTASLNSGADVLPGGAHTAEITFVNTGTGISVSRLFTLAIDAFPSEGAMPPGWVTSAGANAGWEVTGTEASEGIHSLRNVDIGDSQTAAIEYTADFVAGSVSFDAKVSSEINYDYFRFYIDGAEQVSRSGEVGWESHSFPVTAGIHTLKWEYDKDFSLSNGSDTAWIDAVVLPAETAPNQPPSFGGYAIGVDEEGTAVLSLGKLLNGVTDPEGDSFSVTSAGPASNQGGVVTLGGSSVSYEAPIGVSGPDSFQVTVTDEHGAATTAQVAVTIRPAEGTAGSAGRNPASVTMNGSDAEVRFHGIPGRQYRVQRSTDLTNWTDIGTVTASSNGEVLHTDTNPPQPSAYYRLSR